LNLLAEDCTSPGGVRDSVQGPKDEKEKKKLHPADTTLQDPHGATYHTKRPANIGGYDINDPESPRYQSG